MVCSSCAISGERMCLHISVGDREALDLGDLLADLIEWHSEQASELEREQDGETYAEFHRNAEALLRSLVK